MKQYIPELDADIELITRHYGLMNQMDIAQEECAELIQAISKLRRAWKLPTECDAQRVAKSQKMSAALEGVNEEMADVLHMVWQMMHLLGNTDEVLLALQMKVKRTLDGIRKEADHET
jgi:NTP pyrophosphatase (non-canonical NTP hydrolase)